MNGRIAPRAPRLRRPCASWRARSTRRGLRAGIHPIRTPAHFTLLLACFSAAGLSISGCETPDDTTADVACESNPGVSGHVCTVYSGPGLETTCVVGTSPTTGSCPTANVLGTCSYTLSAGGIGESVSTLYYSDGGVDGAVACMRCAGFAGSTWILPDGTVPTTCE